MTRSYNQNMRAVRTVATRTALIEAFHSLLDARPFAAVTMEDVATHAGVALRTAYYHFPSRAILLAALLENFSDDARLLVRLPPAPTFAERVRRHVGQVFALWATWGDLLWRSLRQGEETGELADAVRRCQSELAKAVKSAYFDLLDAAPSLSDERHRLALLIALLDVSLWHNLIVVQGQQPEDAADAIADLIVAAWGAPE